MKWVWRRLGRAILRCGLKQPLGVVAATISLAVPAALATGLLLGRLADPVTGALNGPALSTGLAAVVAAVVVAAGFVATLALVMESRRRRTRRLRAVIGHHADRCRALRAELHATNESYRGAFESMIVTNDGAMETLRRSNEELDDFAYISSHDLKEPLRGIQNYAAFLLEDYGETIPAEGRRRLESIIQLTERMRKVIDTLLHYSQVGKTELAIEVTSLDEVLDGVVQTLQVTIEEKNVAIQRPRPLPTIQCDRARIGEVFQNLIANAVKYNTSKTPRIEVGYLAEHKQGFDPGPAAAVDPAAPGAPRGGTVYYVRDNGVGVKEKHQDAIFRIFKWLPGPDRSERGTGAGLTIVKKIVERHGGRIWLESEYGNGSTFFFTLDAEQHDERANEQAQFVHLGG